MHVHQASHEQLMCCSDVYCLMQGYFFVRQHLIQKLEQDKQCHRWRQAQGGSIQDCGLGVCLGKHDMYTSVLCLHDGSAELRVECHNWHETVEHEWESWLSLPWVVWAVNVLHQSPCEGQLTSHAQWPYGWGLACMAISRSCTRGYNLQEFDSLARCI